MAQRKRLLKRPHVRNRSKTQKNRYSKMWELWAECLDCESLFPVEKAKKIKGNLACPNCKSSFLAVGVIKKQKFMELSYDPPKKTHVRKWKIKEKGKIKPRVKKKSGGHKDASSV